MARLTGISNIGRDNGYQTMSGAQLFCRLDSLLGSKQAATVGNNTIVHRTGRYCDIALNLHGTDVVTVSSSGDITLDSGGWQTTTTRERMNQLLQCIGFRIYQKRWQWYLSGRGSDTPYSDGFVILYSARDSSSAA
jgi:hypothetical protein